VARKVTPRFGTRSREFPNVKVHRGNSLDVAPTFAGASLDWVYIDGDHSASAVDTDIRAWFPKIKKGGALVGDDFDWLDEHGSRSVQQGLGTACEALNVSPARIDGGQYLLRLP
jgi:hypothetical protein